jgi:hypothetical protein
MKQDRYWHEMPNAGEKFHGRTIDYPLHEFGARRIGRLEVDPRPGYDEKIQVVIVDDISEGPYSRLAVRWRLTREEIDRIQSSARDDADFIID